ncbi:hypothetical protein GCM10027293_18160 [Pontibacter aydingkolensis]
MLLAVIVQGYSFAQTISTTLGTLTEVKTGNTRDFTVTTQGSGQGVIGRIDFDPYVANDIILQYQAPGTTQYVNVPVNANGVAEFGPFTLTQESVVHNFKILFNRGDTYGYTLGLFDSATPTAAVGSAVTGSVTVATTQEATIDGTLDTIDNTEPGVETGKDFVWTIFVTSGDRVGENVNIQIKLDDPAQRNNFTLEYDANRAITNGGEINMQPLTFNELGIATIGPAAGEALVAGGIEQVMRINFTQPGTYSYRLQLRRDDGNILAFTNETITVTGVAGIDDMIGGSRISVYPTLADGAVRVDLGDVRNASISVTDMLGRVVMQRDNASGAVNLNTRNLAKGTYFVKVIKGNDVAGSRFIVR